METDTIRIAEHFSVGEPEVKFKEYVRGEHPVVEVFVNEFRVGTGISRELATRDAIKNGKYALAKGNLRAKKV